MALAPPFIVGEIVRLEAILAAYFADKRNSKQNMFDLNQVLFAILLVHAFYLDGVLEKAVMCAF